MSSGSYSIAQILLIKATEDEKALEPDCLSDSILGFHAQQAVEKLLKALLSARSVPFALTHDLGRLRTLLAAAGESLPETPLALGDLGDFAVVYRYDLLFQYSSPNKNDLIETVRLIREQVIARIAALSESP
jgi:HEPN domain